MKRKQKHNIYILTAALAVLALLPCACAEDDGSNNTDRGFDYVMMRIGGGSDAALQWTPVEGGTRADTDIPAEQPTTIGAFGYNDVSGQSTYGYGEVFNNVPMYHKELTPEGHAITWFEGNDWPYETPMPWLNRQANYRFQAYSPWFPSTEQNVGDTYVARIGASYIDVAGLSFKNLPGFSANDVVVANHILEYKSTLPAKNNTVQGMTLRHLLCRLRFCFMLGPEFSQLRKVKITKVEVLDNYYTTYNVDVRYDMTTTENLSFKGTACKGHPISGLSWSTTTLPSNINAVIELLNQGRAEEIEITKDAYEPVASLYLPPYQDVYEVNIRVTYDVYDLYDVLLRKSDVVEGNVRMKLRAANTTDLDGGVRLESGKYYDVHVLVEPKYLYALSDNDFEADGFIEIEDGTTP